MGRCQDPIRIRRPRSAKATIAGTVASTTRLQLPSRQGWFDLQSTGSSPGRDRIPASERGQTRTFLDGDQAVGEGVSNAPCSAAGLRFYYQHKGCGSNGAHKPPPKLTPRSLETRQSPQALRTAGPGSREGRRAGSVRPIEPARSPTPASRPGASAGAGASGPGRCRPALRLQRRLLRLTPPQPAPPRESAPDPAAMLGRGK